MNGIFALLRNNLQHEIEPELISKGRQYQLTKEESLTRLGAMNDDQLLTELGPGPMRFASQERSVDEQIQSLSAFERESFSSIKKAWEMPEKYDNFNSRWEDSEADWGFDDATYLHFARSHHFNKDEAIKHIERFNARYLTLRCACLEKQLRTNTLFPVPGLLTKEGLECFYMRPSRYFPHETPYTDIIDNLVYVIEHMEEKEFDDTEGVAFIANMADWTMENFSVEYCHEFMKVLMGQRFPVKVRLVLIVDPPRWFSTIWTIMCQVLTKEFTKKVHQIERFELDKYLANGYETFLPDDMSGGMSNTQEIVDDFVLYRKYVEETSNRDCNDLPQETHT